MIQGIAFESAARRRALVRRVQGLLFLLPLLCLFAALVIYPVFETFRLSMEHVSLDGTTRWVGLQNFSNLSAIPSFQQVLLNTAIWVVFGVILKVGGGLLLALVLNQQFRGKQLLLIAVLVPWATPYVVSAVTWRWFYDGLYGYFNSLLYHLGLSHSFTGWLTQPQLALFLVLLTHVWTGIPFVALTILSALYGVPEVLQRAARMDGAHRRQVFRYVTWPQIYPVIVILVVLTAIWGFNAFEMVYIMTGGGPAYSSEILVTDVYRYAFQFNNPGLASALAVLSFVILAVFMALYLWINRKLRLWGV